MGFDDFENCNGKVFSARRAVKWFEVPVQKFNDIVPHFVESLKTHQNNILKLRRLEQWEEVRKEQIGASQIINQLASLLSEMENLRSQVTEADLIKFDRSINSSKQSAKSAIRSFQNVPATSNGTHEHSPDSSGKCDDEDSLSGQEQLVAIADLSEVIKVQERRAESMERLQEDIQDINYMFRELSHLVHEQGEFVERIESHVETTHEHVAQGERALARAARYKSGTYPLLGALVGSLLGGPVGLFAGLKVGSLAAVGAGVLGFTGGKILKNQEETVINSADRYSEEMKNKAEPF